MRVADISPGTVLVAGFTGKHYRVSSVSDEYVYVVGLPRIPMDQLQREIAHGKIEVL